MKTYAHLDFADKILDIIKAYPSIGAACSNALSFALAIKDTPLKLIPKETGLTLEYKGSLVIVFYNDFGVKYSFIGFDNKPYTKYIEPDYALTLSAIEDLLADIKYIKNGDPYEN